MAPSIAPRQLASERLVISPLAQRRHFDKLSQSRENENPIHDDPRVRQLSSLALHFRHDHVVERLVAPYARDPKSSGQHHYRLLDFGELPALVDTMDSGLDAYNNEVVDQHQMVDIVKAVAAHEVLFRCNIGFAKFMSNLYQARNPDIDSALFFSEAIRGVERAVKLYNPHLGFQFTTYARQFVNRNLHRVAQKERQLRRDTKLLYDRERVRGLQPTTGTVGTSTDTLAIETIETADFLRTCPNLTNGQRDVALLYLMGHDVKGVAELLSVHPDTVTRRLKSLKDVFTEAYHS